MMPDAGSASRAAAESTFHALLRTFGLLRQVMGPYFARHRISGSQWGILRALQRAGAEGQPEVGVTELGQRLLIRPASVTGAVDRLERQGLVQRSASKEDRRVRRVRLTSQGRKLVARVLKGHAAQIESLFTGLTPRELDDLAASLQRLERHWRTLAGRQPAAGRQGRQSASG
jgi:MarR family transcriptional regulator, 2-MHQ and catechol-resistance regulon repressor